MLLVALLAAAAIMLVTTVANAKPAILVGTSVITIVLTAITLPIALIRVLVTQPDLDLGLGNGEVSIETAAYLGLAALALMLVGAWTALSDERTDAPDSAYTPPPPRPVPGS